MMFLLNTTAFNGSQRLSTALNGYSYHRGVFLYIILLDERYPGYQITKKLIIIIYVSAVIASLIKNPTSLKRLVTAVRVLLLLVLVLLLVLFVIINLLFVLLSLVLLLLVLVLVLVLLLISW